MEWLPHVDKCIIEMLANRTQPSCVQANILVAAKIFHPTYKIVKELPSLWYIQASQTVLVGKFSTENASLAVRKASCGIRANNDPSEANFGCFNEAFKYCRGMDIASAAGLGMTCKKMILAEDQWIWSAANRVRLKGIVKSRHCRRLVCSTS